MKLSYRFAIASVVILFSLTVFPAISMPLDGGSVVSASDEQGSLSTNSVRPSNVTSTVEPPDPTVEEARRLSSVTKDRNEQQQFVAIAKENASINTSELSTFAEVGTITTSRAEIILPSQNISAVQDLDWVKRVQKQRLGDVPNSYAANVQNISSIEAEQLHQNGINGDNVKIGIIGGGPYISNVPYEEQIVDTRNFKESSSLPDENPEHDTAALEQVSEMAPQSDLYVTAIRSQTDFGRAVEYLINKNVDVILTEVTYNVAPGDGTGYVAQKVNQATSSGVTVVTPAGNGRAGHYEGFFYDSDSDSLHNFDGQDEVNRIGGEGNEVNGEYRFTITWSDFDSNSQSDYDLYIYNERTEEYVASSHTIDYYPQTPAEIVTYETNGYEPISLVIKHRAGDSADNVEIHGGNDYGSNPLEYNVPEGSIVPPATAQSAVSVGAYNTPDEQIATYSNQGPIGTRSGITVTGYSHLSSEYYEHGYGGTSGAAPYVAGTVALLHGTADELSPQKTKQTIRKTADHLPEPPNRVGAGLIDASAAVSSTKHGEPLGTITGNIRDEESQPVEGAEVWLINHSSGNTVARATTDSNGRYVFNDVPIGSNYMLDAVYRTQRQSNTIQYAEFKSISNFNMNIIEADTGSSIITGKVVRKNGEPIEGAKVTLVGSVDTVNYETSLEKPVAFVRTGPQGNYAFIDINDTNEDLALSATYKRYRSKQAYGITNDLTSIIQSQSNQIDFVIEDYNSYETKTSQVKVSNADILQPSKNHISDHNKNLVFDVENISADNKKDIITVSLPDNLQASNIGEPSTIGSPHKVSIIKKTDPMKLKVNPDRKAASVDIKIKIPINIPKKTKIKSNNLR
jgi:hypothetical protein